MLRASPYHARIAFCKLLHLFLQSLRSLQLIHQLHLQEADAYWVTFKSLMLSTSAVHWTSVAWLCLMTR